MTEEQRRHAKQIRVFAPEGKPVGALEEIAILDELSSVQALMAKADSGLDAFAGRVSGTVDEHTSGATREQLRTALFKNKPLTRFRRPVGMRQVLA